MTEQHDDEPTPAMPRRSVELVLARMEAKLDVAIAQHQARLDEHSRRIAENTAAIAAIDRRTSALEQLEAANAAAGAAAAAARTPPTPASTWISLAVSILLALYIVLDHYGPVVP